MTPCGLRLEHLTAWPSLPEAVKAAILMLVKAAQAAR
jgi:hypothetical protein